MLREYEAVLKAAADPNRARMLKMLEGSEMCVCQIIAVIGLSQSTVSKHLTLLRDAGLLDERKVGRWVYYTLAKTQQNGYALPLLGLLSQWLEDDTIVAEDAQRSALIRRIPVEQLCSLSEEEIRACGASLSSQPKQCTGNCECEEWING
jgi:DNA-binding transcriptional ArsR family regulator